MTGLEKMKQRLNYNNYDYNDNLNVKGKYKSFLGALKNSYQAEWITLDKNEPTEKKYRCLINPSRLTEQFDKKVISIDFDSGVKEGTIFWWDRTKSYWLVSLQQHTEEAYFRGIIGRANYEFEIDGKIYRAIVKGPDENSESWNKSHNIYFNKMNYSLVLQIAKDDKTVKYFTREKIVKMKMDYPSSEKHEEIMSEYHNWKVVATDKYSSDFLIDVYLDEWFDNTMEDNAAADPEPQQDLMQPHIEGPLVVYGYDTNLVYSIVGTSAGKFVVNSKIVKINRADENSCELEILTGKANKFILKYVKTDGTTIEQEIIIKSL